MKSFEKLNSLASKMLFSVLPVVSKRIHDDNLERISSAEVKFSNNASKQACRVSN